MRSLISSGHYLLMGGNPVVDGREARGHLVELRKHCDAVPQQQLKPVSRGGFTY